MSISIRETVFTYVPMSLFHARTAGPISTKLCTHLHTNLGKDLNTSMNLQTQPPDPKLQNLNRSLEKNFALQKNALNFSRAARGPGWLVT